MGRGGSSQQQQQVGQAGTGCRADGPRRLNARHPHVAQTTPMRSGLAQGPGRPAQACSACAQRRAGSSQAEAGADFRLG